MEYWHGTCPICDQGRLFITLNDDAGELFLLCEECESAWRTPEEIDVRSHHGFEGAKIRRANSAEIESFGWSRYTLNQVE
ncbi:hypothetical protein [Herbaspirillum huttiense]|uniref:Uncharacterized protein n=2 Tax=Herbaspirillum huttiense TaxID=863372 RepID=A0AAJ2HEC5_9BURK|nr:hypothetical protein [Herbaspirillum huttiense]MDR9838480.1 hypothetical protein [Herbaspirillum huttiense]